MSETAIDRAFLDMEAAPGDEAARARFHERVLDGELRLLLDVEPETDDSLDPAIFEIAEGRFVLAFDADERLAAFLDAPAPFAALTGRRLAVMIAGHGLGIGLNLGAAPSATLLPAETVDWLAGMASASPEAVEDMPRRFAPPRAARALIAALDGKLAAMAGVIGAAHLVAAEYADGRSAPLLVLTGVPEAARSGVAAAIAETARLSGGGAALDLAFLAEDAPVLAAARRHGLTFELPEPEARPEPAPPAAPGSDPSRPPILRR